MVRPICGVPSAVSTVVFSANVTVRSMTSPAAYVSSGPGFEVIVTAPDVVSKKVTGSSTAVPKPR